MKQKTVSRVRIPFLAALMLSASFSPSFADVNYDYGDVKAKADDIKAHTSSEIRVSTNNIIEALRLQTGQLSGNLSEQVAANAKIADAQDDQETKRRIEDAKLQATREAAPTVSRCITATSAIASAPLSKNAEAIKTATSQSLVDWQLEGSTKRDIDSSETFKNAHCEKFSTEKDVKLGYCDAATATSDIAYADVDASRSLFADETLPEKNSEASNLLLANIVGSDPWPANNSTMATGEEITKRNQIVAKRSIATESLAYIKSNKEPLDSAELAQWADARAAATGLQRGADEKNLSVNGHLELQARSWFFDQDWVKGLQDKTMDAKVADIADIQAFQTYQNFKTYQLMERVTALLATSLAIAVDQEKARVSLDD